MTDDQFETHFRTVAHACQDYLSLRVSSDVGSAFGSVIDAIADGRRLAATGVVDRFDELRQVEARLHSFLANLAASVQEADVRGTAVRAASLSGTTRLFVYGTLKRGYSRSAALAGQRFLGEATTQPVYRIFDCGGYPGLVEAENGNGIHGEVWEVDGDCLSVLDEIEGVALRLYGRSLVRLQAPYTEAGCQAYFFLRPVLGLVDCGESW